MNNHKGSLRKLSKKASRRKGEGVIISKERLAEKAKRGI